MTDEIRPDPEGGCSDECPSHDGKRCRLTGCQERTCVPAWRARADDLARLRSALAEAEREATAMAEVAERQRRRRKDAERALAEAQAEVERLTREMAAADRALERWRHGEPVEGDYVCPDSLAMSAAQRIALEETAKAQTAEAALASERQRAEGLEREVKVYRDGCGDLANRSNPEDWRSAVLALSARATLAFASALAAPPPQDAQGAGTGEGCPECEGRGYVSETEAAHDFGCDGSCRNCPVPVEVQAPCPLGCSVPPAPPSSGAPTTTNRSNDKEK